MRGGEAVSYSELCGGGWSSRPSDATNSTAAAPARRRLGRQHLTDEAFVDDDGGDEKTVKDGGGEKD